MNVLANATRWGEDRNVKYLLYTGHYDRALQLAAHYRENYAKLLTLKEPDLIDDPELQKEILKMREWGLHSAVVLYEPIFPRHPYQQVQRVLF